MFKLSMYAKPMRGRFQPFGTNFAFNWNTEIYQLGAGMDVILRHGLQLLHPGPK